VVTKCYLLIIDLCLKTVCWQNCYKFTSCNCSTLVCVAVKILGFIIQLLNICRIFLLFLFEYVNMVWNIKCVFWSGCNNFHQHGIFWFGQSSIETCMQVGIQFATGYVQWFDKLKHTLCRKCLIWNWINKSI